jgi:hypothetical protein
MVFLIRENKLKMIVILIMNILHLIMLFIFLGIWSTVPSYVELFSNFVHIAIGIYLVIRFCPYHSKYPFHVYDHIFIFTAGVFMLEATLIHRLFSTSWGREITVYLKKYGDWFKSLPIISDMVSEIKKMDTTQTKEKIKEKTKENPFNDVIRPTTATSSLTNSSSTYSVIEKKKEAKAK